jgi:hypothetical protein
VASGTLSRLSVCLSLWTDGHERLDEFYSILRFKCLSVLDLCLVNMIKIPAPKIVVFQILLTIQNRDFLENGSNDFDQISVIYGDHGSE